MDESIVNSRVDDFLVDKRLKAGGVAIVYKGYDPSTKLPVAIKLLQANWAEHDEVVERFDREVRIMSQINHPHIVRFIAHGKRNRQPYIVMEFMPGGSLSERLKRISHIKLGASARLISQIASGLDYAHRKDIVHRDIKPGNILMRDDTHAALTDFGIARVTARSQLTMTGYMPGTPHYMSPEQARGAEELGASSDIYSLAVIAFLLMTGKLPFTGDGPLVIINKHLAEEPPAPTDINPDLPKAVDDVLLKALSKNPKQRHQSARGFSLALDRAVRGYENVDVVVTAAGVNKDHAADSQEKVFSMDASPGVEVATSSQLWMGDLPKNRTNSIVWLSLVVVFVIAGLLAIALVNAENNNNGISAVNGDGSGGNGGAPAVNETALQGTVAAGVQQTQTAIATLATESPTLTATPSNTPTRTRRPSLEPTPEPELLYQAESLTQVLDDLTDQVSAAAFNCVEYALVYEFLQAQVEDEIEAFEPAMGLVADGTATNQIYVNFCQSSRDQINVNVSESLFDGLSDEVDDVRNLITSG